MIGADPGTILAAVTPVPETLSEYQFAGLMRGAVAAIGVAMIVIYISLQLGRRSLYALLDRAPVGMAQRVQAAIVDLPELGGSSKLRASGLKLFTLVDFAGH